jgi:hypothetical protein
LYKEVLQVELPWREGVTQARVPKRTLLVLTRAEVERVLGRLPSERKARGHPVFRWHFAV